jgi:hypothetical protein
MAFFMQHWRSSHQWNEQGSRKFHERKLRQKKELKNFVELFFRGSLRLRICASLNFPENFKKKKNSSSNNSLDPSLRHVWNNQEND